VKVRTRRAIIVAGCTALVGVILSVLAYTGRPASAAQKSPDAAGQQQPAIPQGLPHGQKLPPLRSGEIRLMAVGADMLAPTRQQSAAVRIPAAAAGATARARAPMRGFVTAKPTTRLMIYTNLYGATRPGGTMAPSVPPTLSWIVTFNNAAALVVTPIGFKGRLPALTCQYVAAISAVSGRQIDAYEVCEPKP
jgi:hypothetical protein